MKRSLTTFSWFCNIVLYFVSVGIWLSISDELVLCLIVSAVTVIMTFGIIIWNKERYRDFYVSSYFKNFSSSIVNVFLVFCILGFINYLSFKHPVVKDFSERGINTLTDQSRQILSGLESDVSITVVAKKTDFNAIGALVDFYRNESSKISVDYIDAEMRPDYIRKHLIDKVPSLIIESENKLEKISVTRELEITNSIIRVTREKNPTLCYTLGHGERKYNGGEKNGFGYLFSLLKKSSYDIRPYFSSVEESLPKDCDFIMIWGPVTDFHSSEIPVYEKFLKDGGNLLVGLDPHTSTQGDKLTNLRDFLTKWGVKISNDIVVEPKKHVRGSNGIVPFGSNFSKEHSATNGFSSTVFFPLAGRVLFTDSEINKGKMTALVSSSKVSWAEKGVSDIAGGKTKYDEGIDYLGPHAFASVWESENEKTKIIAFSNTNFVSNAYQNFSGNFILLTNMINWIANEERMISFNQAVIEDRPVFISAPQVGVIFYFSVVFLPLSLIGFSILLYRRKRIA